MIAYETRIGTVSFSKNYFAKLIGNAVSSCYGVVEMVPSNRQKIFDMVTPNNRLDKGIKVSGDINDIVVELHIIVLYGMNINAIAKSITHKVKYTVFEATGINVKKVNVHVDGVTE